VKAWWLGRLLKFQANTVRTTRILSLFFLGKQVIHHPGVNRISRRELQQALLTIRNAVGGERV
jgi:hypothetical protein